MKTHLPKIIAIVIAAFALLTLFLSSSVIFDLFGIRAMEGNYVLFVVWANFISSILYLFAAYGFINAKKWTTQLLGVSAFLLVVAFLGLIIHINSGELYESKTVVAMVFRICLTFIFTILAYFMITKKKVGTIH